MLGVLFLVLCLLPGEAGGPGQFDSRSFCGEKANALTTATSLTGFTSRNRSSVGTELEMNSCLKRGNNVHALALALSAPCV